MRRFRLPLVALILAAAVLAATAGLAAYPERPVKLIVPWAAGGDTDAIFRPFGPQLQKHLGATHLHPHRTPPPPPAAHPVHAPHDYIPSTYYTGVSDVSYNDFEPVCTVSATPSVLTASPKTKWTSWQELLGDAKARPGPNTGGAPPPAPP